MPPLLLVVTGLPAAGKSTLGRALAADLRLPFVTKDEYKQALYDGLPGLTTAQAGPLSFALMYHVAGVVLAAGGSAVMETHFYRGLSEPILRDLVGKHGARLAQLHCHAPLEELSRRHGARVASGARPRIDGPIDYAAVPAHWNAEPLALDAPLLQVDTTREDAFRAALDWARAQVDGGAAG